jgi:protein gp37
VSEGCRNCYAASMALRLEAMGQAKYAGTAKRVGDGRAVFTGKINLSGDDEIDKPLTWRKPRRIFVNSMSDLFHDDVPPGFVYSVFEVMAEAHWHTFQVLTKRPQNIMPYMKLYGIGGATDHARPWPRNVWIGTSVENQKAADERIPHLLKVPARVRFLSMEPLLGPVDLGIVVDPLYGVLSSLTETGPGIHWIIAGGESGANARPMHPEWARSLRDQAQAAGVAFHFKQWGEFAPLDQIDHLEPCDLDRPERHFDDGPRMYTTVHRVGKKAAGRMLDGAEWNEFPE